MITGIAGVVTALHVAASAWIALYATSQAHLCARSFRYRAPAAEADAAFPPVLVQLPVRNERRVIRALLESVAGLDWPADRLRIQVLDDSDDETTDIARATAEALAERGLSVQVVRRPERVGYKAGALAYGLEQDDAPFVLILDADFRPRPDFLKRAMAPLLADPGLGLLQARWGHINRDESLYTRAQAFHLDAHFSLEQRARSIDPLLMGFNGTAGIWRRAAIEAAGGWSADTLTEDLDLAFRAQLTGWRLGYLDTLDAPAELPADVRAIRSQQHRWMKGGAQVSRKLLGPLWRSDRGLIAKLQGTAHLLGGTVFFAVVMLLLLTPLLHPLQTALGPLPALGISGAMLQVSLFVLLAFYGTTCVRRAGTRGGLVRMATDFVPFLALSTGLALHNALAVLEGWFGGETPFVRTPKRGLAGDEGAFYVPRPSGPLGWMELMLAGWGALGLLWALASGQLVLAVFLAVQSAGCAAVALGDVLSAPSARPMAVRRETAP